MSTEALRTSESRQVGRRDEEASENSVGALGIVGVLAFVIVVLWVGIYVLMMARS